MKKEITYHIEQAEIDRLENIYSFIHFVEYLEKQKGFKLVSDSTNEDDYRKSYKFKSDNKQFIGDILARKETIGTYTSIRTTLEEYVKTNDLIKNGFIIDIIPFDDDKMKINAFLAGSSTTMKWIEIYVKATMDIVPWWCVGVDAVYPNQKFISSWTFKFVEINWDMNNNDMDLVCQRNYEQLCDKMSNLIRGAMGLPVSKFSLE
jgi:hypothetical protein